MSAPHAAGRRRLLDEAAEALEAYRSAAGLAPLPRAPGDAQGFAPEAALRLQLEETRRRADGLERELAEARRAAEAAAAENRRLAAEAAAGADHAVRAEKARALAAEAESRALALKERATLLSAECVRLESMRRKAEEGAAEAEAAGRAAAEGVRRELRAAHAALDRTASEAGSRDARAKAETEGLAKRLEQALTRLQALERERRLESARGAGDASALHGELQRAQAVAAALRAELASARDEIAASQRAANEAVAEAAKLRAEFAGAVSAADAERRAAAAERQSHAERAERERKEAAAENERLAARFKRELDSARASSPEPAPAAPEPAAEAESPAAAGVLSVEDFLLPPSDLPLDPAWARLVRLIRPPAETAYAHLRRLSMTPLNQGQKTMLRMAAASIAQATDSLSSLELSVEDGAAANASGPLLPLLESAVAAWEPSFRRRGVALIREWQGGLPEAPHEPKLARALVYHALRNALEAVPRGGRLTVRAGRGPEGALVVEFLDDGTGFPAEWLERRFEPFACPRPGRAGLGLSIVRRALRRWGGDAEAENGAGGRGARLKMIFAPPRAPAAPAK